MILSVIGILLQISQAGKFEIESSSKAAFLYVFKDGNKIVTN
jgi:hypothetical protein